MQWYNGSALVYKTSSIHTHQGQSAVYASLENIQKEQVITKASSQVFVSSLNKAEQNMSLVLVLIKH